MDKKILIIIPAYNEEESIVPVITVLQRDYPQFDYVIINDGSSDRTEQICREHDFHLVSQPINLGLAGAFQTGMKYALKNGYDAALQFDADGQHLPQYIQPMLDKLSEGYDIVIGSRFVSEKKPFTLRMLGNHLISFAIRMTTGKKINDPTSGMRMYNRRMIREFATQINHTPEPDTISYLMRRGAKVGEVQVEMRERVAGTSYLNLPRSIGYMLQMAVSILVVQWFRGGTKFSSEGEENLK